ncbi:hypothetical protein MC885_014341, partial [Smutsia gigantea]
KKRAGLEGVRPAIRVRTDQCREKKSYINICYVDKSIDKRSLSRALFLSVPLSCFPPGTPNLPEQPKIFALTHSLYRHPSHLGDRDWGALGRDARRDSGPEPLPNPPEKAGDGSFRPGRPPLLRSAAAGRAGGWREEGSSRAPRPARPPGKKAGFGRGDREMRPQLPENRDQARWYNHNAELSSARTRPEEALRFAAQAPGPPGTPLPEDPGPQTDSKYNSENCGTSSFHFKILLPLLDGTVCKYS